ncbi:TetM/TetW/TetO/TetS family tetracycline resistance ribosomal protection protein [Bacillus sp. HMF5848]|uniref:GTP-binding protein n=1 Tax=Bacillus sp. HMF5848 TaxID=2495421 RepID=UPI000F782284|nr:TetM/TetW/TetO/TetS family tetracycline resistance ribosomal protection protein [Bacillus sp. HMF5848]RSK29104.1 TetM/TetW/TetO/TetS family tetracycline resistance ribosomal protection protein [Bacillus sp. HMF5848]
MFKTVGVLAHVDAGKTTFAEQLLYHTNTIRQRGRVDHKDTFLDSHEIEKERGITVFADQATFSFKDSSYYIIDTPGHVDFSAEMERAIQVMDAAIVIISAVEGVEGHTETVWQLLQKYNVPTFFYINKIDRVGADVERVLQDIHANLTTELCDISLLDTMPQELIENIAERDETLLEYYLHKGYDKNVWLEALRAMVMNNNVHPFITGSALQDIGVTEFLDTLHALTQTDYQEDTPFSGIVYKVRYDENNQRIAFVKALSGSLHVRDEVRYNDDDQEVYEKITQIRVYNGSKYKTVDKVQAGELFAVVGLSMASDGTGLGSIANKSKTTYNIIPTIKSKVIYDPSHHVKDVLRYFKILDEEDSALHVTWDERLQEIHIQVMGKIQLEVLQQIVKDRFGISVTFGQPEIIYKETITNTVRGYGHFEPLGHYAEVHLQIEPAIRNSGVQFSNNCHANDLAIGHQNLIRQHVLERGHHSILTGSALTDVKITLLTGRAHNKHTSGGDFKEATYRAIRQGLEKAQMMLLEPYYDFKIKVNIEQMGRIISDIQKAHGSIQPPQTIGETSILTGKVPVATFLDYSIEFAAITQGRGSLQLTYGGYGDCHNATEVIEQAGYDKNADFMYTSSSIFCAKGKGYTVLWDRAEAEMHCLKG